jgi:pimeloyl-ACP methyl ester carboxylesterase
MEQLTAADGTITGARAGTGEDIVILHSLLCDRMAFDAVLPRLSKRHRVTLINLPGFHGSRSVAATVEAYTDFIARAFQEFQIASGAVLMGNGFGGTLALAFAHAFPATVSKLIIADSAAAFPSAGQQAFLTMARMVQSGGMGAIASVAARRVYHDSYIDQHPEVIDERRAALLEVEPEAFLAACEILATCDLAPLLASISKPTLVVYGSQDQATPPQLNNIIARSMPNARAIEIENCGHCPPLEMPERFLSVLQGFIDL